MLVGVLIVGVVLSTVSAQCDPDTTPPTFQCNSHFTVEVGSSVTQADLVTSSPTDNCDTTLDTLISYENTEAWQVDLEFIGGVTQDVRKSLLSAKALLQRIIIGDTPDFVVTSTGQTGDDIIVLVTVEDRDDVSIGGDVTAVGPDGQTPAAGDIFIDTEAIPILVSQNIMDVWMLRTLLAAIGGDLTWWNFRGLVDTANCQYVGPKAVVAYNAVFSNSDTAIPLESTAGCQYWKESLFGNEVYSATPDSGDHPLSIITLRMLEDAGFTVDANWAQPYTPPGAAFKFRPLEGIDIITTPHGSGTLSNTAVVQTPKPQLPRSTTGEPTSCDMVGSTGLLHEAVLTVSDQSGNSASCSVRLIVVDSTVPVINTCGNVGVVVGSSGLVNAFGLDVTEKCSFATSVVVETVPCGALISGVVATVIDADLNCATCTTQVTALDIVPPTIQCKASTTIEAGSSPQPADFLSSGPTDDCDTEFTKEVTYDSKFNITLEFLGDLLAEDWKVLFARAARRWEEIIVFDLPDYPIGSGSFPFVAPPAGTIIDDIYITAEVVDIDGPFGTLGAAGPLLYRSDGGLPAASEMIFDLADIQMMSDDNTLYDVILHEMGHAVGIGPLWRQIDGLLANPPSSCPAAVEPQFLGVNALKWYNNIFSLSASYVPVDQSGGQGTCGGHWNEERLDNEAMTGYVENPGIPMPISRITIGSLEDVGYQVNYDRADDYTPPSGGSSVKFAVKASHNTTILRPQEYVMSDDGTLLTVQEFVDRFGMSCIRVAEAVFCGLTLR